MSAPDAETQGGGPRGGPRRWTGKGPRPARHIPWPEVGATISFRRARLIFLAVQTPPICAHWTSQDDGYGPKALC